jgi:pyridinium-3,5-biscarboxylic acid mononucleotide synthase
MGQSRSGDSAWHGDTNERDDMRLDYDRETRKGIPEIVLAEVKTDEQVLSIVRAFVLKNGRAVVSRLRPGTLALLEGEFPGRVDARPVARAAAVHAPNYKRPRTGGHVGILTAGTSDIPVAEEARLVAEEMGCQVTTLYDVGVAGLHRLLSPLRELLASDVAVLVVCAGMDGALPSVVSGLSPVPVIGVPTSIGYGAGGKGRAALLAMLQTCAPGLTVVNIDNGTGAGATAALIANRVASAQQAVLGDAPKHPGGSGE